MRVFPPWGLGVLYCLHTPSFKHPNLLCIVHLVAPFPDICSASLGWVPVETGWALHREHWRRNWIVSGWAPFLIPEGSMATGSKSLCEPRITVLKTTEEKGAYIPSGRGQWGLEFRNPGETPKHCLGCALLSAPGEAWIYTGKLPPPSFSCLGLPFFLAFLFISWCITSFLALKGSSFNSLGQFTGHWTIFLESQLCHWGNLLAHPCWHPAPTCSCTLWLQVTMEL